MRRALAMSFVLLALPLAADEFRVDRVRESLLGTYRYSTQLIDGVEVVGGERIERDGAVVYERALRKAPVSIMTTTIPRANATRVYLDVNGEARLAWKTIAYERPMEPYAEYYDAATGAPLRRDPLFWSAKARVFEANPVVKLNDPSLRDQNDSAAAVPASAYSIVDIDDVAPAGALAGPYVQIVDTQSPQTTHADASQSLMFDRSQPEFEEVNAYFHIDRSARYLESLGYSGSRRLMNYVLPIDPHAVNGTDNSYYVSGFRAGEGELFFGDGGTDDAEDSDLMLHELGHAIQDWIAPGTFTGSSAGQPRALGEGFGDYWAFSSGFEQSVLSGRDAFCIADWDARCFGDDTSQSCSYPEGANCLRRVDSTKTMRDYNNAESSGNEHRNGEIWSSALRQIFLANVTRYGLEQGKRITDTLVIEGTFGVPPNPTFAAMARRLLDADRGLYGGANASTICTAMLQREILPAGGCDAMPRGELTLFQSAQQGIAIADVSSTGITSTLTIDDARAIDSIYVDVDIAHSARGDLQLTLIAPDGTSVVLQFASLDRTADVRTRFGFDTLSAETLDVLRGHSARGTWKLVVADVRPRDVGTLRSWGLVIRFAGDAPANARPSTSNSQTIPAVAHVTGVNGTTFVSDVHLFNRSTTRDANVTLVFTPSGVDGTQSFGAMKLTIRPEQLAELDDVVAQTFRTTGTGQLEVQSDGDIVATSRTYTESASGTYGQFVGSVTASPRESTTLGATALTIAPITVSDAFRTNVGLAELRGGSGVARFTIRGANGAALDTIEVPVAPYSHVQLPITKASGDLYATLQVVSGTATIAGYASVVDNRSGDAIFVRGTGELAATRSYLPAAHTSGANGTEWRTDVTLVNPGTRSTNVSLTQLVHNASIVIPLASGEMRVLPDILARIANDRGVNALLAQSDAPVIVNSRTANGSYGQFVEAAYAPIEREAVIAGVEESESFRTNIGLLVTGGDRVVTISVYDAEGKVRGQGSYFVATNMPLQIPLETLIEGSLINGRVKITGSGDDFQISYAYGSVIDNRSSDAVYIPAR